MKYRAAAATTIILSVLLIGPSAQALGGRLSPIEQGWADARNPAVIFVQSPIGDCSDSVRRCSNACNWAVETGGGVLPVGDCKEACKNQFADSARPALCAKD